jgi:hypothetical protein
VSRLLGTNPHKKDPEVHDEYGVKYHRYWYNEETNMVFCLAEASNKEAAETVHQGAHGGRDNRGYRKVHSSTSG